MLHVIFLPVTLMVLTAVHFWRIRKDGGISRPMEQASQGANGPGREGKFYSWPVVMWAELGILLLTVAVLLVMAFLFDAPLRERANPDFAENPAKSPWYFLGIQELVSYSAFAGGVIIPVLFLVFLISIPYKDREDRNTGLWFSGPAGRKLAWQSLAFAILFTLIFVFVLIRYGWFRDWFPEIPQVVIMGVNPATLSALFYILWAIGIRRMTGSSRLSAIALFTCVMTGFIIYTAIGIWFRGPNWEFYWSSSQWPVF
jgi:quinol-cytochrome oxidoreductase complex cytochrome b subunit